jgi:hypothetical protein
MAEKYPSLAAALEGEGITQTELARLVTKQRRRRDNGKPLKLSQNFVSNLVAGSRTTSKQMAEAISEALKGKIEPAAVMFGKDA